MVILTDCDGVLVDWMSIYHEWMKAEGHEKVSSSYELHERYGLEEETSDKYMRFFNMSAEIEFLPPLRVSSMWSCDFHRDQIAIPIDLHIEVIACRARQCSGTTGRCVRRASATGITRPH